MDILFSGSRKTNAHDEPLPDQFHTAGIGRLLLAFCIIAGGVFLLDRASEDRASSLASHQGDMQ
ncbi:hypothetical protein ABMA32_14240 [Mesorhizobium sp. VNQ89]|uniref:hypothetical protein n=1 Tax=Mesorhizobium quangtriensis TaxID=3157709 RepID=UPI0032B84478